MTDIKFRVWFRPEKKMYFRGYQKWFHVLLCDDDYGRKDGKGIPVKRVNYDDCEMLQGTGILDRNGQEIFEGDFIRIQAAGRITEGTVGPVPDMFKSRRLHPLHDLLAQNGIPDDFGDLIFEVLGNRYERKISV